MAKKANTPRPPSTVQAPKRRDTRSGGLASVPRWSWLAGAVVLVAVVAGVALAVSGGKSSTAEAASVGKTMAAAGCTLRNVKPFPPKKNPTNFHDDVPALTSPTKGLWSTDPPATGGHFGAWAVWGFYRQAVNPRQIVHNEEHGGVIIWWGPKVPKATVDQLSSFYQADPNGMFGTPYAALGDKIALTAWTGNPATYYRKGDYGMGHIAICSKFDQTAFAAFRDAFRGKGPEGIPITSDAPGMGP